MTGKGKKGGKKFCYEGDVSIADFANSTKGATSKRHPWGKAKSSFNTLCKEAAHEVAVNSTAVTKGILGEVDIDCEDIAPTEDSNSAIVDKRKPGKKKRKPGKVKSSPNLVHKDITLTDDSSSAIDRKRKPGKKKRQPRKVKPSLNLLHKVQQLNIQEQDRSEQSETQEQDWYEQSEIQVQDWYDLSEIHNDGSKEVKPLNTEDLAWDEQPEDEDSGEELAWYEKPDDYDLEDSHYANDDKKSDILGLNSDDQCTKKGKEVEDKVSVEREEMEQYRLLNNLLIHGLEEKLCEDTTAQVVNLFQKHLKLNIKSEDITLAQRIRKQEKCSRSILVTFKTYSNRRDVFSNKSKLKGSGVVIAEDLTAQRLELYHIVRKQNAGRATWTQDGKVFWINNDGVKCSATRKADLEAENRVEVQNEVVAAKTEEMEQKRLLKSLWVHGLEEELCEDITTRLVDLFRKHLNLNTTSENIRRAERLPGKRDILLTFKTYNHRIKVYSRRKKLISSGITITEVLTAQRSELYDIVREKYGEEKTRTFDGKVFFVNNDGIKCSVTRKADLKNTN